MQSVNSSATHRFMPVTSPSYRYDLFFLESSVIIASSPRERKDSGEDLHLSAIQAQAFHPIKKGAVPIFGTAPILFYAPSPARMGTFCPAALNLRRSRCSYFRPAASASGQALYK